jgi:hypothetical protein
MTALVAEMREHSSPGFFFGSGVTRPRVWRLFIPEGGAVW